MANEDKFSKTIEDEELDEVAGGNSAQVTELATLMGRPNASAAAVTKALDKMGIEVVRWHREGYFGGGQEATFREKVVSEKRGLQGQRGWLTYGEVKTVVKGFMDKLNAPEPTNTLHTRAFGDFEVV